MMMISYVARRSTIGLIRDFFVVVDSVVEMLTENLCPMC